MRHTRIKGHANICHVLNAMDVVDERTLAEYTLDLSYKDTNDDVRLLNKLLEDGVITRTQRRRALQTLSHLEDPNSHTIVKAEQRMVRMRLITIKERAQKILDKNGHSKAQ